VVTKPVDTTILPLTSDVNVAAIDAVINSTTGRRLLEIGPEVAEDYLLRSNSFIGSAWFTTYGGVLRVWPEITPSAEEEYIVRGQRIPGQPGSGATSVPDIDVRLHRTLCHYVIALMYANQEDEVLEEVYMKRWMANFAAIRRAIFTARSSRPLVLNGGLRAYGWPTSEEPIVAWNVP
jgi:hypothetical protein